MLITTNGIATLINNQIAIIATIIKPIILPRILDASPSLVLLFGEEVDETYKDEDVSYE